MTTMQEAYEEAILRQDKYHLNTEYDYALSKEYFKAGWGSAGKEFIAMQDCIDDMGRELDFLRKVLIKNGITEDTIEVVV